MNVPANRIHCLGQRIRHCLAASHGPEQLHRGVPLSVQCSANSLPCGLLFPTHGLLGFGTNGLQLRLRRRSLHHEEAPKLTNAVELLRPSQTLRGLVPLV